VTTRFSVADRRRRDRGQFARGLSGTASKDIIVHDVSVPQHPVLLFADTPPGLRPGAQHHLSSIYRLPLPVLGAMMLASTAVATDAIPYLSRLRCIAVGGFS